GDVDVRSAYAVPLTAAALACGGSAPTPDPQGAQAAPPPESEAPVALNPDVPIGYPPALFEQRIDGDVVLRLFVDSTGRLVPESTRVAESSDYSGLDSAALAGSAKLRFAPAKRHGVAVATTFLQPVEFRHPGTPRTSAPPATVRQPPRAPAVTPRPVAPPPRAPALPVRTQTDTARLRPDTARPRPDTTRAPPDTTPPPTDTGGPAH
ncbi:MAG: energy transducer TonB, partial [Gemmatimonadales bacterium]